MVGAKGLATRDDHSDVLNVPALQGAMTPTGAPQLCSVDGQLPARLREGQGRRCKQNGGRVHTHCSEQLGLVHAPHCHSHIGLQAALGQLRQGQLEAGNCIGPQPLHGGARHASDGDAQITSTSSQVPALNGEVAAGGAAGVSRDRVGRGD